jgi:quercetin dioxygenase-like cupin family protein
MKKLFVILILLLTIASVAQDIKKLNTIKPDEEFENIWVKKISDDHQQTAFVIWVKEKVRLHKHEFHSENIYVISGKGEMTVGQEKFEIKKGDFFNIPKNTPHGLIVVSSKPIKVLSIQSPKFEGKDRIFIDE